MKPFWTVCMFIVGFIAMAASCGPKHKYCPDEPDMECRPRDDGGPQGGTGGRDLGPCDGGAFTPLPDGGVKCL